jgi:hypothetical protein
LSFDGDILAFWLGQCFGYFFQNLGTFFLNLLVTLHVRHLKPSLTVYQRNKILNMISKPLACSIRIRSNIAFSKMFCKQTVFILHFKNQKPKRKILNISLFKTSLKRVGAFSTSFNEKLK